ncbi:ACP phosphodiesterase [Vibrio sp. UCD-FRSSP16_10]|uniref:acyl carrier protein phosphodiesterase n=1 Tax=unclassified Vibrio TaxID=2614977 RepID=UPI0007FE44BB|nr:MULTISPECIES: ACP phosphodiesterase [unclassified Vibrio]OBT08004.1 ACP phosphodiesterase [Vibrio sp. UCD-FRSSP16_30]OBT17179.1 ACP phosphodiesterase [Vibrio sp. UCD-FRSSP16_10]
MNFLGHLHLADVSNSSLLGNLLGDFVRGNPDGLFNDEVTKGIRLHRFIDSFTDSHSSIVQIKPLFGAYRRFSPIALDVFWDHCLIHHWDEFHSQPLEHFFSKAKLATHPDSVEFDLPEQYQRVIRSMWDSEWIASYQELDNVGYALSRMSMRSPRMAPLAQCFKTLQQHYSELDQVFVDFYPDVIDAVTQSKLK